MKRWLIAALGSVAALVSVGCRGPAPAPPPAVVAPPPPAAPLHTDAERFDGLATTPGFIWGLGRDGPVRWNRQTGQAVDEGARGAPTDATVVAGSAGRIYFGTPSGLVWQDATGAWRRFDDEPARAGVIDLAPRTAGGLWLATPTALAAFEDGRATVHADRYGIRDIARDAGGALWIATRAHGVVALQGQTWVEHTTAQGVCGNDVRHVATSPAGRLVATCADKPAIAIRDAGQWSAWRLDGVGPTLIAAWPVDNAIIIRTPGRWLRMRPGLPPKGARRALSVQALDPTSLPAPPPPTPAPPAHVAPPSAVPVAMPPSAAPVSAVPVPAPPSAAPPAPPSRYPASAPPEAPAPPAKVIVKPPPVPMPPPVAPPPQTARIFASTRASVARQANPPQWLLEDASDLLPADGAPSASTVTADGTLLHALPYRGVVARRGAKQRRYVTSSLLPARPSRLEVDQGGRLVLLTEKGQLLRFDGQRFMPWRLPGDAAVVGIAAGQGPAYALAWSPAPPPPPADPTAPLDAQATPAPLPARLIVYRSDTQGPFTEVARVALPAGLTDPIRVGRVRVDGATLSFPLFVEPSPGERRAVGLAHVRDAFARIEVWSGRLGYAESSGNDGPIYLPDAWVNAHAIGPGGVRYVATNAGLVRVEGRTLTVFDENAFIDSEVIIDVAVDAQGTAWVGTLEGLGTLADGKWQAVAVPGLDGRVNAVAVASDGVVWVGASGGLWRRDPAGTWDKVAVQGRREAVVIKDMVPTGKGGLWLLTAEGIVRHD